MLSDQARAAIGAEVAYRPRPEAKPERGVIEDVNGYGMVLVRYDGSNVSKSTPAADLEFFHQLEGPVKLHRLPPYAGEGAVTTMCDHGKCPRRHDWMITCSCGERFYTGRLKYSRGRAEAHRLGREYVR